MIVGGNPNDGLFMITGAPGSWYANSTKTAATIFSDLSTWLAAGYNIVGSVITGGTGLIANHAYTVLGVYTLSNGA